jgi:hypothetical protein
MVGFIIYNAEGKYKILLFEFRNPNKKMGEKD